MSDTLASNTLRMAVLALERLGHDAGPILAASQISRKTVDSLWARVPITKEREFWKTAVELTGDTRIGLKMSDAVPFGTFPLLEYVGASCQSNLQAIQLLARYSKIIYGGWNPEIEESDDCIEFRFGMAGDPEERRQTSEFSVGVLWDRLKGYSSENLPLLGVHFRHGLQGSPEDYVRRFGDCPLFFDQAEDLLVFSPRLGDVPCKNSNPLALGSLLHGVEAMLARLSGSTGSGSSQELIAKIKGALEERLASGEQKVEEIAKALGMSQRTLQRRLEREGRSLRALTSEVRREQAVKLLKEAGRTVEEIALMIGYSDFKSFNRAFQGWFRMTPSAYRKSLGN